MPYKKKLARSQYLVKLNSNDNDQFDVTESGKINILHTLKYFQRLMLFKAQHVTLTLATIVATIVISSYLLHIYFIVLVECFLLTYGKKIFSIPRKTLWYTKVVLLFNTKFQCIYIK